MYGLEIHAPAGELANGDPWEVAPGVSVAVTGVRIDEYETDAGATRTRLAIAVEARNGSEEPFELVNEFGLLDGSGAFRRRVWVDPAKRPQAIPGVRVLAPDETVRGEIYVSIEQDAGAERETFVPAFGGLVEHSCQGCGHDGHDFLPRAIWQPVTVRREVPAVASRPGGD